MTDWISVKDRLPENGSIVLAYYKSPVREIPVTAKFYSYNDHIYWEFYSYCYLWDGMNLRREWITHWMPLPKPQEVES